MRTADKGWTGSTRLLAAGGTAGAAALVAIVAFWPQISERTFGPREDRSYNFVDRINLERELKESWPSVRAGFAGMVSDLCVRIDDADGAGPVRPEGVRLSRPLRKSVPGDPDAEGPIIETLQYVCGDWTVEVRLDPATGAPVRLWSPRPETGHRKAWFSFLAASCEEEDRRTIIGREARIFSCADRGFRIGFFTDTGTMALVQPTGS